MYSNPYCVCHIFVFVYHIVDLYGYASDLLNIYWMINYLRELMLSPQELFHSNRFGNRVNNTFVFLCSKFLRDFFTQGTNEYK